MSGAGHTAELLPCPFCGGEQIAIAPSPAHPPAYHIICKACGAQVEDDEEVLAITAWNTRAASTPLLEALEEARDCIACDNGFNAADGREPGAWTSQDAEELAARIDAIITKARGQ